MDYRQRIIDAFKELAMARGFSGVTMEELAARAGVSKRTVYRYFRSKEELVSAVVEDFLAVFAGCVKEALDSSAHPVERITNIAKVIPQNIRFIYAPALHDVQKHYPHLWEKIERFREERIRQIIEIIITNSGQGHFRDIHPKVFTAALLASIRAVANPTFILDSNLTPEETVRSLLNTFFYGIVAEGKREDIVQDGSER